MVAIVEMNQKVIFLLVLVLGVTILPEPVVSHGVLVSAAKKAKAVGAHLIKTGRTLAVGKAIGLKKGLWLPALGAKKALFLAPMAVPVALGKNSFKLRVFQFSSIITWTFRC